MGDLKARITEHTDDFVALYNESPFTVFLCGPSLDPEHDRAAARLRLRIQDALKAENFNVFLGEDESIANDELKGIGINLQDSELEFVRKYCNSVVIVADSVGSFCELGLFSWHFAHIGGVLSRDIDFILLVDAKYKNPPSYLNQGPALAVHGHGRLDYVDFETYDAGEVVEKLRARRGTYTVDRRGRPRGRR